MKPVVLAILDGWGIGPEGEGNAVTSAATPHLDRLFAEYPHTQLQCSGEAVGLQPGQMGDSNVGHLNIGAGRVVYQPLVRINRLIADGSLEQNGVINDLFAQARGHALHLLGLLSDGGVHSHIDHLFALLKLAKDRGCTRVYVHAFLDGRDVPPESSLQYIDALEDYLQRLGVGQIATVTGRYYAMDRDRRWERLEEAYRALVLGEGERAATAQAAIEAAHARGETDEFVRPVVIRPEGIIRSGDAVFMFNYRADRARELVHALHDPQFDGFERQVFPQVHLAGMMQYEADYPLPYAVPHQDLNLTLGEVVSLAGMRQLRAAETEKYAHVTFFLNGGREEAFANEDRLLIPSPKVPTYDLQPEMSAFQVIEQLLPRLADYDLVVVNFANLDMVGHTGDLTAAIAATEAVDSCVGRLVAAVQELGGALLITADHGNAEQMIDPVSGEPHTYHTANPVPCLLINGGTASLRQDGVLADLAPTVLELLGISQPAEMSGRSLLQK